jgi:hypothetical protein
MEISFLSAAVISVYVAIAVELIFLPVPSVASTYRLFSDSSGPLRIDGRLKKVRDLGFVAKIVVLFLPTGAGVVAYCIPLLIVFFPSIHDSLLFPSIPFSRSGTATRRSGAILS